MGDILNSITKAEMEAIRLRVARKRDRHERACAWCDKPAMMLADQKFCCAACRTKYSQAAATIEHERLVHAEQCWHEERAALVQEIADLRRQLLALRDQAPPSSPSSSSASSLTTTTGCSDFNRA